MSTQSGCYPLVQPSKVQLSKVELLDNKIVQKYTLNYFIIQKFNPGHVQKILAWRDKPNEFMKELVQEPVKTENQPLQGIIQDKLTSLGIK